MRHVESLLSAHGFVLFYNLSPQESLYLTVVYKGRLACWESIPSLHTYPHFSFVYPQKQLSIDTKSQGDPWGSLQTQLITELLRRDVLLAVTSIKWTKGLDHL